MPGLTCLTRTSPEPIERVCVPRCADGMPCPSGFTCDAATMVCKPTLGSCTGFRAAVERRACSRDEDCPPAGATMREGLYLGMCFAEVPDSGIQLCHQPCRIPADCPASFTCDTRRGFCLPEAP